MQLSRLFEIVYILLARKRVTAKELAERFEVSPRTIYRDVEALSMAGVPVFCTQGAGGGISINDSYVLNKSALSDSEQAQILLALKSLSAIEHDGASTLLMRLGSLFAKDSDDWIEVDFSRWGYKQVDQQLLSTIKDGITCRRKLTFTYYGTRGHHSSRCVCPTKLVYKSYAWYLQAYDADREDYRTFKMIRMADIVLTDDLFDRYTLPPAPPIEVYTPGECPPLVAATLRYLPPAAYRAFDSYDPAQLEMQPDGSVLVRAELLDDGMLAEYILCQGMDVEVLEPPALRYAYAQMLRRMMARYDEN